MRTRLSIEDKLLLECSQSWVQAPSALILPSGGRSFEVKVRPGLQPAEFKQEKKVLWGSFTK